jgi:uncharacterized protein (TIGR02246 family)
MNTTQTNEVKAIHAIEKSYDDAWNKGKADELALFFTPDAIIINPYGEIAEGKIEFENIMFKLFEGRFKDSTHQSEITGIHFPKVDVAVVDGEAKVIEIGERGENKVTVTRFTDIMVKECDKWLIADTRAYIYLPLT